MQPETRRITPVSSPVRGTALVPGSKSITNRALALAALGEGEILLTNTLFADDTRYMMGCLTALGFDVFPDESARTIRVMGQGGKIPATEATLFVGNSGTTTRFITPLVALGHGDFTIDGVARMRERPIGDLTDALAMLGVSVTCPTGCPPLTIHAKSLRGGHCTMRADKSSQFLSGLLLSAPSADADETIIHIEGPILSAPYITMTVQMVEAFGGKIHVSDDARTYTILGRQRRQNPMTYAIEPDASAASYFWGVAAITGGSVTIENISKDALQGDVAFVEVLEQMGCTVTYAKESITVEGAKNGLRELSGCEVDMNAISDTVMTIAAIAPFASSPTIIHNIAHIRHKETDRISAVVTELRRLGVHVDEREDGMTIHPASTIKPATIQTYDDHRMAMAFALVGLKVAGITIADPTCVNKTFPDYFEQLDTLCGKVLNA
jgi:3-phosphoshikimate 1-carboxyvinyltransferase